MLTHILYGMAALAHGGLLFTARAAAPRGQQVKLAIVPGPALQIDVAIKAIGAGTITITIPAGMTEGELVKAFNRNLQSSLLAIVEQKSGDGTAEVQPLALTSFTLTNEKKKRGLVQLLSEQLGINDWANRNMAVASVPKGLLWPAEAKIHIQRYEGKDHWIGSFKAGISHQQDTDFASQNIINDMFRRALFLAIKTFDHIDLIDIGPAVFGYTNTTKALVAGQVQELKSAELHVIGEFPISWTEDATAYDETISLDRINLGLYREGFSDDLGPGGTEILDTILSIQPEI